MGLGRYAFDFGPHVVNMFNSMDSVSGTIAKGIGVQRNIAAAGETLVADPGNETNITRYIVGVRTGSVAATAVTSTTGLGLNNILGVAMRAIPPSTWGPVCVGGPCEILCTASCTVTFGTPLQVCGTLGAFISSSAPFAMIHAIAVKSASIPAAGYCDAFIEPINPCLTGLGHGTAP
jgi:hypothetical protein